MEKLDLPKIEFEGPLGQFWTLNSVPIEAIVKGIRELFSEALRRGYKEETIIDMLKETKR